MRPCLLTSLCSDTRESRHCQYLPRQWQKAASAPGLSPSAWAGAAYKLENWGDGVTHDLVRWMWCPRPGGQGKSNLKGEDHDSVMEEGLTSGPRAWGPHCDGNVFPAHLSASQAGTRLEGRDVLNNIIINICLVININFILYNILVCHSYHISMVYFSICYKSLVFAAAEALIIFTTAVPEPQAAHTTSYIMITISGFVVGRCLQY